MATAAVDNRSYQGPTRYEHRAFDSLPELEQSSRSFWELDGYDLLRTAIRDVFMRHGVNESFAVQILHRHFEMNPEERLVELGAVSSPWPIPADEDTVAGGHILPRSWRVFDGELQPYEFHFVPKREYSESMKPVFPQAFVAELRDLLKKTHLDQVLGITLIDHSREESEVELMEVTYGRNSVMIPAVEANSIGEPVYQATWSFVPKEDNAGLKLEHGICAAAPIKDGLKLEHGICAAAPLKDGLKLEHGICAAAPMKDTAKDGVKLEHGICAAAPMKDTAKEGVKLEHGICAAAPMKDGLKLEHGICAAAPVKDAAKDGVKLEHGICAAAPVKAPAKEGVKLEHGICAAAPIKHAEKDGVKLEHGICAAAPIKDARKDGIKLEHGICAAAPLKVADKDGLKLEHGICAAAPLK